MQSKQAPICEEITIDILEAIQLRIKRHEPYKADITII